MAVHVGLLFPGPPRSPATWSGSPAGLTGGLEGLGINVDAVRAEPPAVVNFFAKNVVAALRLHRLPKAPMTETLRLSRAVARVSPELAVIRTLAVRSRLARAHFDGLIQIGTGYTLPRQAPIVTFEDITIVQALELGYPEWRILSQRARRSRIDRQRRAYEEARACCLTTRWAAESAIRDYGVPPEKVHVVGVGRNHAPKAVNRDWTPPRFLFVGRDWQGKNGPRVLAAFTAVREQIPEARLDVVGVHPPLDRAGVAGHGPLRMSQAEERRRLELLYESATCFLLPSLYEAAGIAYLEAAAAGVPSIGTRCGGAADLIGEGGRVVDPLDEESIVAAMLELADPNTARAAGARALQRSELFTWRKVSERVLRALALPGVDTVAFAEFL